MREIQLDSSIDEESRACIRMWQVGRILYLGLERSPT